MSSDNYVSVDADVEQCQAGDDEVGNVLLVEAAGIAMKADLIVVGGGHAIASALTPTTLLSIIKC